MAYTRKGFKSAAGQSPSTMAFCVATHLYIFCRLGARTVLGDSDLAMQAFARGLEVFADDPIERDRITASARQLGLGP
jgi:hypothetical protein